MVTLKELKYLDALAQHKHFGRAAAACFVSQPTLSGQIIKLEERLGLSLLERGHGGVLLTPAGERLLSKGREVLRAADEFDELAGELRDPLVGELKIGLIPTLAPYLLPHIMAELAAALPDIDFILYEQQTQVLLQYLRDGEYDILILPWLDEMSGLEAFDLFEEEFYLAVPAKHELSSRKRVRLDDLNGHHVLTLEDGHCLREQALGFCFSAGADEDQRFQGTSLETLRYMVATGFGITLLPALAVPSERVQQGIVYLPFYKPAPSRRVVLLTRASYPRMVCVRSIVASVRAAMRRQPKLIRP